MATPPANRWRSVASDRLRRGLAALLLLGALSAASCGGPDPVAVPSEPPDRLRDLPYLAFGPDRSQASGVVLHERDLAWPGINLYGATDNRAYLVDMEGRELHRFTFPEGFKSCDVTLLPGGDLLGVCFQRGVVRLDWSSQVLWIHELRVHHDTHLLPDGTFWAPVQEPARLHNGRSVRFDAIGRFDPPGAILESWSTWDHLEELKALHGPSRLDAPAAAGEDLRRVYDYYHLNTVEVIGENRAGREDPRFRAGNLLFCLRNASFIGVIDAESRRVVWSWGPGTIDSPHAPTMLESGRILLFDNGWGRGWSRVIEVDPIAGAIVWEYRGTPPRSFFSQQRGCNQRLPNGNTLVCESDSGRALEVTPGGRVVWEFHHPVVVEGKRQAIYRMERIPASRLTPCLEDAAPPARTVPVR